MKRIMSFLGAAFIAIGSCFATDYVAIAKNGNVYDEANTKYITVNMNNENVAVVPGMVFSTSEHIPGWYMVEYSPGLHAYIPEQIVANNFTIPYPGNYKVANNPSQSITIDNENDHWTASSNGKFYKGNRNEDIVIFMDDANNPAFSIVDFGNGPIVITYENSVTKFF